MQLQEDGRQVGCGSRSVHVRAHGCLLFVSVNDSGSCVCVCVCLIIGKDICGVVRIYDAESGDGVSSIFWKRGV